MDEDPQTDESPPVPVPLPKRQRVWEGMGPGLWGVREPMLNSGLGPSVGQGCPGLILRSCRTQAPGLSCASVGSLVWGRTGAARFCSSVAAEPDLCHMPVAPSSPLHHHLLPGCSVSEGNPQNCGHCAGEQPWSQLCQPGHPLLWVRGVEDGSVTALESPRGLLGQSEPRVPAVLRLSQERPVQLRQRGAHATFQTFPGHVVELCPMVTSALLGALALSWVAAGMLLSHGSPHETPSSLLCSEVFGAL